VAAAPRAEIPAAAGEVRPGSYVARLNGFDIHYEIHGAGPVLMALPNSWGLSIAGLRGLLGPLEERLTLVYFDPRGIGSSAPIERDSDMGMAAVREDFDALRRHLRLPRVHALGWSNGAMNLMLHAAQRPDTLDRAIFLHGVASFSDADVQAMRQRQPVLFERFGAFRRQMDTALTSIAERDLRTKEFYLEVWFPALFADAELGRRRLPAAFGEAKFSYAHSRHVDLDSSGFDARPALPHIRAGSLVIAGRHDLMPPERVEEVARGIPGSRFVVFEHSGHFAPLEEPDRFVETVSEFLGSGAS
jgi:proline iminopeptidase